MELKFTACKQKFPNIFPALFLAAIICNVFATLHQLQLLPAALVGVPVLVVYPLMPAGKRKAAACVLLGILGVFLLIRFASILDGMKLLVNQLFALSEQAQAYEYDYFSTTGSSSLEAVLWLSVLAGILCALWGGKCSAVLCGGWVIAMAYFGVTPGSLWLAALVLAAALNVLPLQQRWFYGIMVTVLVAAIAFAVTQIAPEPSKEISALDEQLRDLLAAAPMEYEQTPIPTDVPEPEIVPQPNTRQEQPDHGVQPMIVNMLFIILAALTLMLLFIPAVIKDRAAKRSEQNRAGLHDEDNTAAIKAMYLYARRWRSLSNDPAEIPGDVYAIWQKAAYSDHAMTNEQREVVRKYMVETAKAVWAGSDYKKRLIIQYRIAL